MDAGFASGGPVGVFRRYGGGVDPRIAEKLAAIRDAKKGFYKTKPGQ